MTESPPTKEQSIEAEATSLSREYGVDRAHIVPILERTYGFSRGGPNFCLPLSRALDALSVDDLERLLAAKTRAVPIAPVLRSPLDQIPKRRNRLFGNISNLNRGSGHIDDVYKRVQAEASLDHLTLHDLRRTFIIQCLVSGIPMEMVMEWEGHESDKRTLEYYTSFAREDQSALVARVNFALCSSQIP